ncbi:deazaflavin-dependent oxidoreductase (nitroreductase family) [Kineosphaera limosa]|uniref:Nitroreductase family deazaflavin-dependent oxidoreductase n=1 Tax=Kineosphaera limosa NBRC 100340 TaxID=1184609 RepID=K6X9H9_9MICO|nr:nitroreductase family deazaflavin-dependent oxidoreductase [Kineosphaera limosa]NYE01344.1 deazaflavin-dependent oxidoreductase (nitroreductase family) [Kineosphaera limosa]GAB95484.1 hypothetical protein KILIM_021_00240 [Kineosphaera limosa NBRC 100340]
MATKSRLDSRTARTLRAMYPGGRGTPLARRLSHLWSWTFARGWAGRRWVTLEVTGRRSGQPRLFPLGMADLHGRWYLVSMLGECAWVRNVRAADGAATLIRKRRRPVRLVEVPVAQRAPILQRYLNTVPGGRPHIPVEPDAPLAEFAAVADRYPVFEVRPA